MRISAIKEQFAKGEITKSEFISRMSEVHDVLFDFSKTLKDTEIAKIEIIDDHVIMVSRKTNYHLGNVRFLCDSLDKRTVALEAFNFGTYEQEDSEMIYKLITPENVIFDIGANIGWYSNHMAAMQTTGKVYGFEPIPETFKKLVDNTNLNGFKNISLNNLAFSEKKQRLTFYYSPAQTGASSSRNITEREDIVKLECNSVSVDDFVHENNISKVDFIKCDVEGAELFVYQGATETLKKHKPIVFTEMLRKWSAKFGYHPNDIISLFTQLGYLCYFVKAEKLVSIDRINDDTMETNFFFLHKESHSDKIQQFSNESLVD